MRLNRSAKPQSATVTQLVHAIRSWEHVKTKPEQLYWEQKAQDLVQAALSSAKDNALFDSLDALWDEGDAAYERMADLVENCVQSSQNPDGTISLLIAIPVLTWSSNELPVGKTDLFTIEALKAALHKHWLADGVQLNLAHTLYSPDALPDGFCATHKLAKKLFGDALQNKDTPHTRKLNANEGTSFLADCRLWLGVLTAPAGSPLFQAQLSATGDIDLDSQAAAWRPDAAEAARKMFIGCAYEIMPPEGYYEANRSAELDIRGFSLQASALMMMTSLELEPAQIRAVIGACYDSQFEEYRISLMSKNSNEVLQGITWPILGREEVQSDLLLEIQENLASLGITRVRIIDEQMPMDYCDDCGTPLFPDLNAELVHPGSPDEDEHSHQSRVIH